MRKPRDIDAQLKALNDKAKTLKMRRIAQLGELVVATEADALDIEVLAGVLLDAVEAARQAETREAWRRKGAGFFQRQPARKSEDAAPGVGPLFTPRGDGASAG